MDEAHTAIVCFGAPPSRPQKVGESSANVGTCDSDNLRGDEPGCNRALLSHQQKNFHHILLPWLADWQRLLTAKSFDADRLLSRCNIAQHEIVRQVLDRV